MDIHNFEEYLDLHDPLDSKQDAEQSLELVSETSAQAITLPNNNWESHQDILGNTLDPTNSMEHFIFPMDNSSWNVLGQTDQTPDNLPGINLETHSGIPASQDTATNTTAPVNLTDLSHFLPPRFLMHSEHQILPTPTPTPTALQEEQEEQVEDLQHLEDQEFPTPTQKSPSDGTISPAKLSQSDTSAQPETDKEESGRMMTRLRRRRSTVQEKGNEKAAATTEPKRKRVKKLYCICQQPYNGDPMVQCGQCEEWFHCACVKLDPEEAEDLDWVCEKCIEKKVVKEKADAEAEATGSGAAQAAVSSLAGANVEATAPNFTAVLSTAATNAAAATATTDAHSEHPAGEPNAVSPTKSANPTADLNTGDLDVEKAKESNKTPPLAEKVFLPNSMTTLDKPKRSPEKTYGGRHMRNLTNQGKCLYPPCQNKTRVDSYCSDICARADAMRQKAKDFEYLGEVEESRASQRRSRSTSGTSALEKSSLALGHHKKPSISISTSSSGPNSPIFELQSPNQSATEENPIRKNVVKNMTTILKSIMDTALENEPTLFDPESDQESQDKQTMTEDDDLATKEPAHVTTVALDPTDSGVPESIPVPEITSLEATLNTVATDLIVADGTVPDDNDTQGTTSNTPVPQAEPEQINTDPNTTNIEKSPAKSRSTQTMAEELAQLIEEAMYLQLGDPVSQANKPLKCGEKYKGKFRTLLYNLKDKANKVFQIRVITGELTPDELIKMSSEDMANPELKSMSETLRKKSIKNSVLKVQNIPFIKKTHKGDIIMIPKGENEYGDDSNKAKQLEQEMVMVYQNNERTGEDDVPGTESDVFPDSRKSSISTTPTQARHDPLDDILARIGVSTDGMREDSNKRAGVGLAGSDRNKKRKPTFDVEKLLGDEDIQLEIGSDDEGIITTRRTSDGETVRVDNMEVDQTPKLPSIWKGRVNMPQVAEFEAVARQVGGRPLSDTEWADVLSPTMWIEGRIPQDRVTTYVSQTQYSSSREIILLEIEPSTLLPDAAKEAKDSNLRQSDTLLKYFNSRQRYGVVGHNKTKVKDFYLIPLYKAHDIPDCLYVVRIEESKRDCDLFLGVLILTKQPEQRPLPIPAAYQNHPPYEP